jgi:hypothetical protein
MSRILNRPMFRGGGKVSSYGKGIATGLAKGGSVNTPKRGIVDGPGRYSVSMSGLENYNQIFNNTKNKVIKTGADVVEAAKNKTSQGVGKTKNFLNKSKNFLKSKNFSEKGIMKALKKYGPKALKYGKGLGVGAVTRFPLVTAGTGIYAAGTATPVDEKYDIDRMDNVFPMFGDTVSTMEKKFKRNLDESANPNNFYRYNSDIHGPRKEHPLYDPEKVSINPFNKGAAETDLTPKAPTGIVLPGGGDPNMTYTEPKVEEPVPLTMKEQVAKDKALFAELLGGDKAKGKDVSDMLLRFAGSGGNTVGEKFQQYIGNEAQAGPSRTEKINQAAASLAINDYIAGKRSKENMEMMLAKTEKQVDYTIQQQKERDTLKGKDFVEAVGMEATAQKKNVSDTNVIATVIYKQTGKAPKIVSDFANEVYGPNTDIDETKLITGLNIVTFKDRKIVIEKDPTGNLREATEYPI